MPIDKGWTMSRNRNSIEFQAGLNSFIERCKEHMTSDGLVKCPCQACQNRPSRPLHVVKSHIHMNGFYKHYNTWTYHGEDRVPPVVVNHVASLITGEMADVVNDVVWENVTVEEHADGGTSNEGLSSVPIDDYAEVLKEVEAELYPGCTWCSSLNFLAKLLHLKAINKWTDSSFNDVLELFRFALPKDNKLPSSYYEAKKKMRKIGLGYESIHACKNDCCLFWKENIEMQSCPICGESRWKNKDTKGKKVAQKVLRYFPLTPRLKRLYSSRHTAESMRWHATGRSGQGEPMHHPVDGKSWKDFDTRYPNFARETRNVRLGLAADGFNPYGNISLSYSMWPVILTTYNTPPWECMKESSLMLTLLIPGPKSPGKDIDVFLKPLVEELKVLWTDGVQTMDASTNTIFNMRAMLLWTINDFPARGSLSGWSGQGYLACPTCNEDTPSTRVLTKTAYVGHRRFLPLKHDLRKNKTKFYTAEEKKAPPREFSNDAILQQLSQLPARTSGKHPSFGGKKRKRDANELNWTKRSIFFEIPYWSSLRLKHNLDVMHVEKNWCDSLLGTLLMNEKSKDTTNARKDLKKLNIRKGLWLQNKDNGKFLKPQGMYSFAPDERRRFCQFIKGVRLPDNFGSNFKGKVVDNDSNIKGLKSHDCHIMMQRLLPVGIRGNLHPDIATPIIELCSFFKQICARNLLETDMSKAKDQLIKVLCRFEQIFPPAFFDIMIHLVLHLLEEAIEGGPVYMRWMYPFERYMKKLKNYVRNKARPEGSIAEGYVADEALTLCSRYLRGVQTRFNRPERNEDIPAPNCRFHVFKSLCRLTSQGVRKKMDDKLRNHLHWFVLNNSRECDAYKNEFTSEMPGRNLHTEFSYWFKNKVNRLFEIESPDCNPELSALAYGPQDAYSYTSCIVNGVKFVVHDRDIDHITQNHGISTPGIDMNTTFYGQLEEILKICYLSGYSVVFFRCKWFRTDGNRLVTKNNITSISIGQEWWKDEQYILATYVKKVFYLEDPSQKQKHWRVVQEVNHRNTWDHSSIELDNVIESDVIHNSSSSDFVLSANLDGLTSTTLSRVGQSVEVEGEDEDEQDEQDFFEEDDEENEEEYSSSEES